jgi:hypothetical protein
VDLLVRVYEYQDDETGSPHKYGSRYANPPKVPNWSGEGLYVPRPMCTTVPTLLAPERGHIQGVGRTVLGRKSPLIGPSHTSLRPLSGVVLPSRLARGACSWCCTQRRDIASLLAVHTDANVQVGTYLTSQTHSSTTDALPEFKHIIKGSIINQQRFGQ